MKPKTITVTKRDAAIRQLRAAVLLWFAEGDAVSIHTLASAAHEIIHRMFRTAGHRGLIFDSPIIKKEFRQRAASAMKQYANFFKHADHDLNEKIEFNPQMNDSLLLLSIWALTKIGEKESIEESALLYWMLLHNPRLFKESDETLYSKFSPQEVDRIRLLPKQKFLEVFRSAYDPETRFHFPVYRSTPHGSPRKA